MQLTEEQTQRKVRELYEMKNDRRLNMWISSGITAGVLDADLVEKALNEQLWLVDPDVRSYWLGPCDLHAGNHVHDHSCDGLPNPNKLV